MRQRECDSNRCHRAAIGGKAPWNNLVVVHRLLVGTNQVAVSDCSSLDRKDFCTEEAQNQNKAENCVRLPELRIPLERIKKESTPVSRTGADCVKRDKL